MISNTVYPNKPFFEKQENSFLKIGLSLLLFLVSFYWLLDKDISKTILLALALFLHELGHFLAMKKFNYVDVRIFFLPFLGVISSGKKQIISQKQRTIILMAGPLPGIILGMAIYFLGHYYINADIQFAGSIFIFLNVFKLLPFTPLDGGDLIKTLFFAQKEKLEIIFTISSGLIVIAASYVFDYYRLLIIPVYLAVILYQNFKLNKLKSILDKNNINYKKTYDELTNEEYWKIRKHIISHSKKYKNVASDEFCISKQEKTIVKDIKSITTFAIQLDMSFKEKLFVVVICLFINLLPIPIIQNYLNSM